MKKLLSATLLVSAMAFSSAALAHSDWYGKEGQDDSPSYMNHALAKLPAKKASEFRDTMKEARDDNKELQAQVYKLHGELHALLTAPTFDKDAYLAKRTEIEQLHDKMEENRTEAFASAVAELSLNERITLTRALHSEQDTHHKHPAKQMQENSEQTEGEPNQAIKR